MGDGTVGQVQTTPANEIVEGPLHVGGFGSSHTGNLSNFAFADGSVRAISWDIDPDLLRLLGHRADGEIMKDLP
jgi:prepilin-type processing-associated H-X9-DG protein